MSMGFSRQEHWSGLSFPPPGDFPNPGMDPALAGRFSTTEPPGNPSLPDPSRIQKLLLNILMFMAI